MAELTGYLKGLGGSVLSDDAENTASVDLGAQRAWLSAAGETDREYERAGYSYERYGRKGVCKGKRHLCRRYGGRIYFSGFKLTGGDGWQLLRKEKKRLNGSFGYLQIDGEDWGRSAA